MTSPRPGPPSTTGVASPTSSTGSARPPAPVACSMSARRPAGFSTCARAAAGRCRAWSRLRRASPRRGRRDRAGRRLGRPPGRATLRPRHPAPRDGAPRGPGGRPAAVRERLARRGRVLVEVPNWRSTERLAAGPDWVDLRPEQHRWQFTPATLRVVLGDAGYRTVQLDTLGEPMPSPGTILLAMGVPIRFLPAARPPVPSPAGGGYRSRSATRARRRAASPGSSSVRSSHCGWGSACSRIAVPQDAERSPARALDSTTP